MRTERSPFRIRQPGGGLRPPVCCLLSRCHHGPGFDCPDRCPDRRPDDGRLGSTSAGRVSRSVDDDAMAALVAAAQTEGNLTTIALPHNWCDYGDMLTGFTAKYGIKINELNPDGGSGDEIAAIEANKASTGPQAPDVIDVGLAFGPQAKLSRRHPALQGQHLGRHPGHGQGCRRLLVRRLLRRAWPSRSTPPSSPTSRRTGRTCSSPSTRARSPSPVDPTVSNQAISAVWAAGIADRWLARQRPAGPRLLQEAQRRRQPRAEHRQDGDDRLR